jgi:hypothetical protein
LLKIKGKKIKSVYIVYTSNIYHRYMWTRTPPSPKNDPRASRDFLWSMILLRHTLDTYTYGSYFYHNLKNQTQITFQLKPVKIFIYI